MLKGKTKPIIKFKILVSSDLVVYTICNYSGCQAHSFPLKAGFSLTALQAASSSGGVAFFILLDIVGEPMNSSSYAQCATPQYLKTVQFNQLTLNREPLNFEPVTVICYIAACKAAASLPATEILVAASLFL